MLQCLQNIKLVKLITIMHDVVGILQYEKYSYVLILCNYMLLVFHLTRRVIHQNFCQELLLLLLLLLYINIKTLYII